MAHKAMHVDSVMLQNYPLASKHNHEIVLALDTNPSTENEGLEGVTLDRSECKGHLVTANPV